MLDLKFIRDNPESVKENIRRKFQEQKLQLVDEIIKLDKKWREIKQEADNLRHERNKITLEITNLKKERKDTSDLIKKAQLIPQKIRELEEKETLLEGQIKIIQLQIPNIVHKSVPIGRNDKENIIRKIIGKPKIPKFEIKHHAQIAEELNIADFDSARETSGKGFYFLKGDLALLDMALINYARDYMTKKGFLYTEPPLMIRKKVVNGVMSFTEMENMMYKIEGEDLYMIGTSEHPLIGMFINKTINTKERIKIAEDIFK